MLKLYDSRELVPEASRAAAVETADHKFAVSEDDPATLEAGKKLIDEERAARKLADDARKKAEKERDELKRKADAKENNLSEAQLQQLRDEDAARRKPLEEERDRVLRENRQLKLTDRVKALALASGVMPDRIAKAMLDLERRVDLTEDGNSIVVKDASGKPTAEKIEDFLKTTYKAEAPFFYAGSGASGSGSSGSTGKSGEEPAPANQAAIDRHRSRVAGAL